MKPLIDAAASHEIRMRSGGRSLVVELRGMRVPAAELDEENLALESEGGGGGNQPRHHSQLRAGGVARPARHDLAAVTAGLTLPYSSGPTEGNVNRLKAIKRQMYGRASLDLLRKRVIHHPP